MISSIGGSGDNLDRLKGMLEEERAKASGRARVAHDTLSTEGIDLKETEQKALADQALEDFAAKEGILMEPKVLPPSAPAPKTLGPSAQ